MREVLKAITHSRPADVFDLYTTVTWDARCEAVQKLRIELREGRVIVLPVRQVVLPELNRGGAVEAEGVRREAKREEALTSVR